MTQSFGQLVLAARKKKGLTQQQLAKKIGYSKAYIGTIENDRPHTVTGAIPKPAVDVVDKLAEVLDVPINEMRLAAGYAPTKTEETRAVNTALRFDRLPQNEKERLSKLFEFLDAEIEKIEQREKQ